MHKALYSGWGGDAAISPAELDTAIGARVPVELDAAGVASVLAAPDAGARRARRLTGRAVGAVDLTAAERRTRASFRLDAAVGRGRAGRGGGRGHAGRAGRCEARLAREAGIDVAVGCGRAG